MPSTKNRCNMIENHIFNHLREALKILQRITLRDGDFLVFKNLFPNFELENLLIQSKTNCTYH